MIILVNEPLGKSMTYQDHQIPKKIYQDFGLQQQACERLADHYYKHVFKPRLKPLVFAIRNF